MYVFNCQKWEVCAPKFLLSSALTHVTLHRIGSFVMISLVFSEPFDMEKRIFFKVFLPFTFFLKSVCFPHNRVVFRRTVSDEELQMCTC